MKMCPSCQTLKVLEDFYLDKRSGRPRSYCKSCTYDKNKCWKLRNAEKVSIQNRKHQLTFKLKNVYKIDEKTLEELVTRADGRCMICNQSEELVIDHDHATNRVRGLLCSKCNLGLGHFKDSKQLLVSAMLYLES